MCNRDWYRYCLAGSWCTTVTDIDIVTGGWCATVTDIDIVTGGWCATVTDIDIVLLVVDVQPWQPWLISISSRVVDMQLWLISISSRAVNVEPWLISISLQAVGVQPWLLLISPRMTYMEWSFLFVLYIKLKCIYYLLMYGEILYLIFRWSYT